LQFIPVKYNIDLDIGIPKITANMSKITKVVDFNNPDFIRYNSLHCRLRGLWDMEVGHEHFHGWHFYCYTSVGVVKSGSLKIETKSPTGSVESYDLVAGDVFCLRSFIQRKLHITSEGNLQFIVISIAFEILDEVDVLSFYDCPVKLPKSAAQKCLEILSRYKDADNETDGFIKSSCFSVLGLQLLQEILRTSEINKNQQNRLSGFRRIAEQIRYFQNNYFSDISLEEAAEKCCLSASRFHAVFKEVTGFSPYQYIKKLRLENAAEILVATDLSVEETGQKVGWPDPFSFSKIFKKFYGISPQKYRKRSINSTLTNFNV